MKYMGSKRWMLANGLGTLLVNEAYLSGRFVDLFSGTGAVSWHVAKSASCQVVAVDLQAFSSVLSTSVIGRTEALTDNQGVTSWFEAAKSMTEIGDSSSLRPTEIRAEDVIAMRKRCDRSAGLLTSCYGGYYFSPYQAHMLDSLLTSLPNEEPLRSVCLATLISAAARCAAAPGHTAQPFSPTNTGLQYIREAWARDPLQICTEILPKIAGQYARRLGRAVIGDALDVAHQEVSSNDLVFLDPPYSAVQYSRFYHVLETIARGNCGPVSGRGRYPPFAERPHSKFSLKGRALAELSDLLSLLGLRRCRVVMTFPQYGCSNGIVGEEVASLARQWFFVDTRMISLRHSTLGGGANSDRSSRRQSVELVMRMKPKMN